MSIFKKRDKSPYRHIGLALVPPVAFTAVPESPPPTPITKKKKSKVIASPLTQVARLTLKTAQAIAQVTSGSIDDLELSYEPMQQEVAGTSHGQEELYATIQRKSARRPAVQSQFIDEAKYSSKASNSEEVIPQHSVLVHDQPQILPEEDLNSSQEYHQHRQRNKLKRNKDNVNPRQKLSPRGQQTNHPTLAKESYQEQHSPSYNASSVVSPRTPGNKQDALAEEMRMRDAQNREMILQLMKNQQETTSLQSGEGAINRHVEDDPLNQGEHEKLKEVAEYLKKQSFASAKGVVIKDNLQEMVDENHFLKDAVRRLNTELEKYHNQYGVNPAQPNDGPPEDWLIDHNELSPLFASYDFQLKEKNEKIAAYEAQLGISDRSQASSPGRWANYREQQSILVEETHMLMEQLELLQQKMKEMHLKHVDEVARLSQRVAVSEAEFEQADKDRRNLKDDLSRLREEHDRLKIESGEKIPARDHVTALTRCKNELEDLNEQHIKEQKELLLKIKETNRLRSEGSMREAEEKAKVLRLEGELEAIKEARTKLSLESERLRGKLSGSEQRELECQLHLAQVIRVAERASCERSTIASLAEREQKQADRALRQSMHEKWELGKMEQNLKQCKVELASKNKDISIRLQEVEDTHLGQMLEQEREVARMRKLLQQKHRDFDDLAREKRQIEKELENVWQAAHNENRRMMETLHKSKLI